MKNELLTTTITMHHVLAPCSSHARRMNQNLCLHFQWFKFPSVSCLSVTSVAIWLALINVFLSFFDIIAFYLRFFGYMLKGRQYDIWAWSQTGRQRWLVTRVHSTVAGRSAITPSKDYSCLYSCYFTCHCVVSVRTQPAEICKYSTAVILRVCVKMYCCCFLLVCFGCQFQQTLCYQN